MGNSLLDARPGEEEEEEGDVKDNQEDELLKEEEKLSHDKTEEVDEVEKGEEKMSSGEKVLHDFIKDHLDPITETENPPISESKRHHYVGQKRRQHNCKMPGTSQ